MFSTSELVVLISVLKREPQIPVETVPPTLPWQGLTFDDRLAGGSGDPRQISGDA